MYVPRSQSCDTYSSRLTALTTKMIVDQLHEEHEKDGNRYGVATVSAMEAALYLDNRR